MNILPKKRWHVRTKDNIARVRRDEANAAAEEKVIQQRAQLAEQEARTTFLRQQASTAGRRVEDTNDETSSKAVVLFPSDKHINLFNEVEDGQKSWGINKEREAEKKEEQEKYEKNIGYLTYLGQSTLDNKGEQPWYEKSHAKRFISDEKQSKEEEVAKKFKKTLDPLNNMQKYLEISGKKSVDATAKQPSSSSKSLAVHKSDEKVKKAAKHHKSKKKRKHKHSSDDSSADEEYEKAKKLESLRAERLRREEAERKRTEKLLARLRGDDNDSQKDAKVPVRDGDQGYNSQFNPHLARKPKIDKNTH